MKRLLLKSALAAVLIAAFASFQSCASWVEADHNDWADVFEPKSQDHYDSVAFAKAEQARIEREQFVADSLQKAAEAYQAELKLYKDKRAYHKNPHRVMFGWMSWTGLSAGALSNLPDEVDYISIWLPGNTFSKAQLNDLREFQKRGGKAWLCWRIDDVNGNTVTPKPWMNITYAKNSTEAMVQYADHIADLVEEYGFNGFDYDSEPGEDYSNQAGLNAMVNRLRERFDAYNKKLLDPNDPLYNPDRLAYLCIDVPCHAGGSSSWADAYWNKVKGTQANKFDLLIWQLYDATSVSQMETSVRSHISGANNPWIADGSRVIGTNDFEGPGNRVEYLPNTAKTMTTSSTLMGLGVYHIEKNFGDGYAKVKTAIEHMKKVPPSADRWHPLWPEGVE